MQNPSSNWTKADLLELISEDRVEENVAYRPSSTLQLNRESIEEFVRDVSSFANSDGGTIVYGILTKDDGRHPHRLDEGVDPVVISTKSLEAVLAEQVQPALVIDIRPVPLADQQPSRVVYILSIPRGRTAHQSLLDKRYYKRSDFDRVPMEHIEIRRAMLRQPWLSLAEATMFLTQFVD